MTSTCLVRSINENSTPFLRSINENNTPFLRSTNENPTPFLRSLNSLPYILTSLSNSALHRRPDPTAFDCAWFKWGPKPFADGRVRQRGSCIHFVTCYPIENGCGRRQRANLAPLTIILAVIHIRLSFIAYADDVCLFMKQSPNEGTRLLLMGQPKS